MPWRRNPWAYGVQGFHLDLRVLIPASSLPSAPPVVSTLASQQAGNAPLPLTRSSKGQASAGRLIPTILGAFPLDWGAITHSLKEWLLLSQPPSCQCRNTSFAILSGHFGALAVVLGSFPLAVGHYRSTTASRGPFHRHSEFGWGWYRLRQPAPIQSLYLLGTYLEALPQ